MCWQASASMATTPRCRCWPKQRRSPAASGPMSVTTGRLAVRRRRQPCSITPAIGRESIRSGTWQTTRPFCRPTPMAALASSTTPNVSPARLPKLRVGFTGGGNSTCWLILLTTHGAKRRARRRRQSRHWRSRLFAALTLCSISSAPSMAQVALERLAVRAKRSAPLVAELEIWMRHERAKLSRHNDVAKAMDYLLKRWPAFTRFLDDGRICLSNNAAERALRGIALGRKAWLFAGSDRGGERAADIYALIITAKLNDVAPRAWLADVLARISDHPASKLDELLPWNWARERERRNLAA